MLTCPAPLVTKITAIAAMTTESSISSRKIRQNRFGIDPRGLGTGSGRGIGFPLAVRHGRIKPTSGESGRIAMTIAAVLQGKGSAIETIAADASLMDAVQRLGAKRIGALPVVEEDRITGIISERDVIYCLRDHGPEALDWPIGRVMSSPAITASPDPSVLAALALMTQRRIRHLPVVVGGTIRGIVPIGDLVKHRMERIEAEAQA